MPLYGINLKFKSNILNLPIVWHEIGIILTILDSSMMAAEKAEH